MNNNVKKFLLFILDLGINIAIIFGLVVVVQKWFIAPFDVSGASMCNTLNFLDGECVGTEGEKIIINEATYLFNEPERGEIVVFKTSESEDKYYIKRVIGLPGETIELIDGEVFVTKTNGDSFELNEDYLSPENQGNTNIHFKELKYFEVPEGHYFLLGDNRTSSTDSRSCFQSTPSDECSNNKDRAFIPRDLIRGKAWVVFWPLSSIRLIEMPSYHAISVSLEEK